jgi:hypothetical protein
VDFDFTVFLHLVSARRAISFNESFLLEFLLAIS